MKANKTTVYVINRQLRFYGHLSHAGATYADAAVVACDQRCNQPSESGHLAITWSLFQQYYCQTPQQPSQTINFLKTRSLPINARSCLVLTGVGMMPLSSKRKNHLSDFQSVRKFSQETIHMISRIIQKRNDQNHIDQC